MYIKLREIRKENKYSQQAMADKLNISKAFYSQIENEKRNLTYLMAVRISKIFEMKPDEIFYNEFIKRK